MHIGGLQKQSLIDFPGHISAVLFLSGCNFRCPFCHNAHLISGDSPERIAVDQALSFLDTRKGFLDGVVISGGEPTLQPDLMDLCRDIRKLGLAIKLDTNGSHPEILSQLIAKQLLDSVALDIKTVPTDYSRHGKLLGGAEAGNSVRECLKLLLGTTLDVECRTTCAAPFVTETNIAEMARQIKGTRRWALQPYRPESVLDSDWMAAHAPHPNKTTLDRFQHIAKNAGIPTLIR